MSNGSESRKYYRLPYPLDVAVEIITATEMPTGLPLLHLQVRNISKDGVCLEARALHVNGVSLLAGAPYARENRLRMTLTLAPGELPLTVLGEVRWYDLAREEGGCLYQLGIHFLEIQEGGKEQLLKFLKSRQPLGLLQRLFG
ncbi:MAG: PilZ domain-containing protein [Deltaproteobacteria bacterium]|nr:PilZ domain-containing protein [Deltaproteobacteria bacterium]